MKWNSSYFLIYYSLESQFPAFLPHTHLGFFSAVMKNKNHFSDDPLGSMGLSMTEDSQCVSKLHIPMAYLPLPPIPLYSH